MDQWSTYLKEQFNQQKYAIVNESFSKVSFPHIEHAMIPKYIVPSALNAAQMAERYKQRFDQLHDQPHSNQLQLEITGTSSEVKQVGAQLASILSNLFVLLVREKQGSLETIDPLEKVVLTNWIDTIHRMQQSISNVCKDCTSIPKCLYYAHVIAEMEHLNEHLWEQLYVETQMTCQANKEQAPNRMALKKAFSNLISRKKKFDQEKTIIDLWCDAQRKWHDLTIEAYKLWLNQIGTQITTSLNTHLHDLITENALVLVDFRRAWQGT